MTNNNRRGGQGQGQQPLVDLTVTEPIKVGQSWQTTAIAVVRQGQNAWSGRQMKFYLNGNDAGEMITDNSGRVAGLIDGLTPGSYVVEAQVVGTGIVGRVRFAIAPEPTKPTLKPAKLIITMSAMGNPRKITLQVFGENNSPIKGAQVNAIDLDDSASTWEATTETNGTTTMSIPLTRPKTRLKFMVLGSNIIEQRNLYK